MEDKIFKVGYTTYLSKEKVKKEKWTSKILNIISKHKILALMIFILLFCINMNIFLIYNFIKIIETNLI